MKKTYKAPISRTFDLQPECLIASSVNTMSVNSEKSVGATTYGLSNKKSIWDSSSWSNTGE